MIQKKRVILLGLCAAIGLAATVIPSAVQDVKAQATATRSLAGLNLGTITADQARQFGLDASSAVWVNEATPWLPAAVAGIQKNDLILSINGSPVATQEQATSIIAGSSPGTTLSMVIWRDNQRRTIDLTTIRRPDNWATATPLAAPAIKPAGLGYVANDGLHVMFEGGFDAVIQKVIRQANSERQQWEFCTNPPRVNGPFALPRFPVQQQNCGQQPAPFNPDNAATFSVYELAWSPTGTKVGERLSTFRIANPGDNLVPLSKPITGKCVVLADVRGNFVQVRSGSGDRFAFTNPFSSQTSDIERAQGEVQRIARALSDAQNQKTSSSQNLAARMAEFTQAGGRTGAEGMYCPTVVQRPLPPRPNTMSAAAVELQANGSCMDVLLRRHDQRKVVAAISAVDRTDTVVANYKTWKNQKAQCSMGNIQTDDYGIRLACGGLSDIMCYNKIRDVFSQCHAVVRNSCGGGLSAWQAQVERIRREPQERMDRCSNAMAAVMDLRDAAPDTDANLAGLRSELIAAQQQLVDAMARSRPQAQSMSLSDARCGG